MSSLLYSDLTPAMETDPAEGFPIGRNPKDLTVPELRSFGHEPKPILRAIREKCLDCSGGSRAEARRCTAVACPLWPFRMASNPFYGHRQEPEASLPDHLQTPAV